jgi:hypothetical protein
MAAPFHITLDVNRALVIQSGVTHAGRTACVTLGSWRSGLGLKTMGPQFPEASAPSAESEALLEDGFDMLLKFDHPHVHIWLNAIPAPVLTTIKFFPGYRFTLLRLAAHFPEAQQLLLSDPVLLWLIARHYRQSHLDQSDLLSLWRCKRTDILHQLGFPGRKSEVKLLSKLALDCFHDSAYQLICQVLQSDQLNELNRYNGLSENQLRLLLACPELIGAQFTFNAAALYNIQSITTLSDTLKDCLRIAEQLNQKSQRLAQLRTLQRIERIEAIHTELSDTLMRKNQQQQSVSYGEPPLPGSATIVPITRSADLIEEGEQQNHCVFSYHDDILDGHYYVYRILQPQRATLGIDLSSGQPLIDQVYRHSNNEVSKATMAHIKNWFTRHTMPVKLNYFDTSRQWVVLGEWTTFKDALQYAKDKAQSLNLCTQIKCSANLYTVVVKADQYQTTAEFLALTSPEKTASQPEREDLCDVSFEDYCKIPF